MARLTARFGLTRYEADEHYGEALKAYSKGEFEQAIHNMEQAIRLLPRNPEYYATLGFIFVEVDAPEKAEEAFQEALKHYAYEMLAHYGRGVLAFKKRNWEEALAHFNDALIADPERPETLYYLALVHHRKGDNAAALKAMQKAQDKFEEAGDRRRVDAGKWIREFEKLLNQSD